MEAASINLVSDHRVIRITDFSVKCPTLIDYSVPITLDLPNFTRAESSVEARMTAAEVQIVCANLCSHNIFVWAAAC